MFIAMNHGVGTSARYFDGLIPNFFIRETSLVRFMVSGARHIVSAEAIRARWFNRIVTSVLPPQPVYATGMPKARKVFSIWNHWIWIRRAAELHGTQSPPKAPLVRDFEESVSLLSSQTIERNFWTGHPEVRRGYWVPLWLCVARRSRASRSRRGQTSGAGLKRRTRIGPLFRTCWV